MGSHQAGSEPETNAYRTKAEYDNQTKYLQNVAFYLHRENEMALENYKRATMHGDTEDMDRHRVIGQFIGQRLRKVTDSLELLAMERCMSGVDDNG